MIAKANHHITALFVLLSIATCLQAQNSPVFTIGEELSTDSTFAVSITAINFTGISAGNLKIIYNHDRAIAIAVNKGSGLAGTIDYNISEPGVIRIGWYTFPAAHLPDGSTVFNIIFKRKVPGTTEIVFDGTASDMDCQFYNASHEKLNDKPFEDYYNSGSLTFRHIGPITSAPKTAAVAGEKISIQVRVAGFNNIGAVSLTLKYDPAVINYISAENSGGYPGLKIYNPVPGTITVSGITNNANGFSLPRDAVLFTVNCTYLGGATDLVWYDDGTSCEYAGPQSAYVVSDSPNNDYYLNGRIGTCLGPEAPALQITQPDCETATGSILVLSPPEEEYLYSIDGSGFEASNFFNNLKPGKYSITIMDANGCISPVVEATITDEFPRPVQPDVEVIEATCLTDGSARIEGFDEAITYTFHPAGPTTDATGNICGYVPGQSYNLTASATNKCQSLMSEPFTVNMKLEAPVPVISVTHDTGTSDAARLILTTISGSHYLWSSGDTTQQIVVNATGDYSVEVTYQNGCAATSAVLPIRVLPAFYMNAPDDEVALKAFPNPFLNRITFEFIAPVTGDATIEIYDSTGRLIKRIFHQPVDPGRIYRAEFSPGNQDNNLFYYRITVAGKVKNGKIIHLKR